MPRATQPPMSTCLLQEASIEEVVSATLSRSATCPGTCAVSRAGSPIHGNSPSPSVQELTQVSNQLSIYQRRQSTQSLTDPSSNPSPPVRHWLECDDNDFDAPMDEDRVKTPVPETVAPLACLAEAHQQIIEAVGLFPEGTIDATPPYVTSEDIDKVFIHFSSIEDVWDSLFVEPSLYGLTTTCVTEWTYVKSSDPNNYVLGRFAGVDRTEEWTLTKQALAWFGGGEEPFMWSGHHDSFYSCVWWNNSKMKWGKKDTLIPGGGLKKAEMGHVNDKSFLWFSSVSDCWPLPLVCGPDDSYDALWSFTFKDKLMECRGLRLIGSALSIYFCGMFSVARVAPTLPLTLPLTYGIDWMISTM